MKLRKDNWRVYLRNKLFGRLPAKYYIKVLPVYFRILNRNRAGSGYYFSLDEKNDVVIHEDGASIFTFHDHRRLPRYYYPDGVGFVRHSMLEKYQHKQCSLQPDDLVVDVGANVGDFTLAAAESAKIVYAFEPDPNFIRCLKKNGKFHANIEIVPLGASDTDGRKVFYLSSKDADSSFILPENYTNKVEIDSIRLDTWMSQNNIDRIDFLKIDAEGAEIEVLGGLGERISDVRKIAVDGGPEREGKPTRQEVALFLKANRFQVHIEEYQVYAFK